MASSQISQNADRPLPQPSHGLADCVEHLFSGFAALVQANAVVLMKASADLDLPSIDAKLYETLRHVRFLRNATQPVMQLPAEVLSKIFRLVQPDRLEHVFDRDWDLRKMHKWLSIRLVCKHWENVAAATPSLWTSIFLNSTYQRERSAFLRDPRPSLELLLLFLRRSLHLPLSVHIGDTYLDNHIVAIVSHLPHIQELIVKQASTDLTYSPSRRLEEALQDHGAPMLQALSYDPHLGGISSQALGSMPVLRSFSASLALPFYPDIVKSLRQLDLSGSEFSSSFRELMNLLDLTPLLEDLKLTWIRFLGIHAPTNIAARRSNLPNLKSIVFEHTDWEVINNVLGNLSLPETTFLTVRHQATTYSPLTHSMQPLDLLMKDALRYSGPIDRILTKLHYDDDEDVRTQKFSLHAANRSFGMRLDIEFWQSRACNFEHRDFAAQAAPKLLASAQEVWIDRWCPRGATTRSSSYEEWLPFENFVRSSCGDLEGQKVEKLFCHGEAYKGWLDGLTPNQRVLRPAHLLRELHILTPPPADLQCLEKMERMLEARRVADIPVCFICFYLPLDGIFGGELSSWRAAFEQWETWGPTRLASLVEKVEFVRTKSLPRMEVPSFCTEQSEGYWKWPMMWDD